MRSGRLELSGCIVDLERRRVLRGSEEIPLTSREAELLAYLAERAGQDVTMEELHAAVWRHGSQVVSRAAFHTMRRLRAKVERDPSQPEHLLAVHGVGFRLVLPQKEAPLPVRARSASGAPGAGGVIPAGRDRFWGRERERVELSAALDEARLVTLTGLGGMGKTRLACEYARGDPLQWPGGLWFCALATARDLEGIASAVATGLGIQLLTEPVAQLGHALAARGRCLVILDNFEQVAEHAEATVGRWLDAAPEARLLVTSRHRLGLPGERLVALSGLDEPEAVALLRDRAAAAWTGALSPEDEATLGSLAALLEGMPLAIELAAARLRVMSVQELCARMSDRLKLLASSAGRPARHATLRAVLDWSYQLLTPWEKAALAQLSVFEGSFTLEAAEAVLDLSRFEDAPWALDVLQALVDKSLLQRTSTERLQMLVGVRAFAGQHLDEGARTEAWHRHGAFFAALAPARGQPLTERARALLAPALDDLVAACRRAVARAQGELAAATALGVWGVLERQGQLGLASELLDLALSLPSSRQPELHLARGYVQRLTGRAGTAPAHFETALEEARLAGDVALQGRAHLHLGWLLSGSDSVAHLERALEHARTIGDSQLLALAQEGLGHRLLLAGRTEEALVPLQSALEVSRTLEDRGVEVMILQTLGRVALAMGKLDEAIARQTEALAALEEVQDLRSRGFVLNALGYLQMLVGRMEVSEALFLEGLALQRASGNRRDEQGGLLHLAMLRQVQGRYLEARALMEEAIAITVELGIQHFEGSARAHLGALLLDTGQLEEARTQLRQAVQVLEGLPSTSVMTFCEYNLGVLALLDGQIAQGFAQLQQAADAYRQQGNLSEAAVRGTLGELQLLLGGPEIPREEIRESLQFALDHSPDLEARGAALGALGTLRAEQGQIEEARRTLDEAELLLRPRGMRLELAKLLARRAALETRAGEVAAARRALDEAERLAQDIGPRSRLGLLLVAARTRRQ